jgi:CheY-like chemotaxis protein
MKDLSPGGMLILTAETLDPQTEVNFRFNLPPIPPGHPIEGQGVVVRRTPGTSMGIQFVQLKDDDWKAIAEWAKSGQKKRILVADDDPAILRVVEKLLSHRGYEVITAQDGLEALTRVNEERPDAILLDIGMPGLNGLEVCAKLRATEATAAIPVGFLTARTEREYQKQALELGAVLWITKPFRPDKLATFVRVLFSQRKSP